MTLIAFGMSIEIETSADTAPTLICVECWSMVDRDDCVFYANGPVCSQCVEPDDSDHQIDCAREDRA